MSNSRSKVATCLDEAPEARMSAAQDGDCAAYTALLHVLLPLLGRIVQRRFRFLQTADRDDLVQDILLSLHASRATYDPRRPFMPWLMSIAHKRMVDRARRDGEQGAHELLVGEFAEIAAADELVDRDCRYGHPEALREAVRALPLRQRTAIELLKLRDLSLREAAEAGGLGAGALRVSVHRVMKKLRGLLA
jgi:RNA polymerase sigma factor (sigma-70 family)